MKNNQLFLSSNGYEYLESYTEQLYGKRGTFRHNLERYLTGDEYMRACRNPRSIEDIPEIDFKTIKMQIERETHFSTLSNAVIETWAQLEKEEKMDTDFYYEVAGIMGLCPGNTDWHETLFPHLVDLFVSSKEEGNNLWKSVKDKPNIVEIMVRVMSDGLRSGQMLNCTGRDFWSQGYARNYFRGENAYNVQCRPSLFRNLPENPYEAKISKIIGYLQINEFALWINSLHFVQKWPYGDVFHGAIAQHYGIPTNGIDITSDFKTALFFACCRYENRNWRPLRPEEYENKNSRSEVIERNGDSRYGILFSMPADISNMSRAANIPELHFTGVTPVGFQPFMRCGNQSAYVIEAGEPYDLYRDMGFSKHKFRLCPEICEWIFCEMDGGAKIYPKEMLGTCTDVINIIKTNKIFSEAAFVNTMEHLALASDSDIIKLDLSKKGYEITSSVFPLLAQERLKELENEYLRSYEDYLNQLPTRVFRPFFCI